MKPALDRGTAECPPTSSSLSIQHEELVEMEILGEGRTETNALRRKMERTWIWGEKRMRCSQDKLENGNARGRHLGRSFWDSNHSIASSM